MDEKEMVGYVACMVEMRKNFG